MRYGSSKLYNSPTQNRSCKELNCVTSPTIVGVNIQISKMVETPFHLLYHQNPKIKQRFKTNLVLRNTNKI